jgi:hypothetical protein
MDDIRLVRKSQCVGSCYFEFGIGPRQRYWSSRSVYMSDEAFDFLNPTFQRFVPEFDYYGFTRIGKAQWDGIIAELRALRDRLATATDYAPFDEEFKFCLTPDEQQPENFRRIAADLVKLIDDLTAWVSKTLEKHAVVRVIGM